MYINTSGYHVQLTVMSFSQLSSCFNIYLFISPCFNPYVYIYIHIHKTICPHIYFHISTYIYLDIYFLHIYRYICIFSISIDISAYISFSLDISAYISPDKSAYISLLINLPFDYFISMFYSISGPIWKHWTLTTNNDLIGLECCYMRLTLISL